MFLRSSQVLTIAIFVVGEWNILPSCCQVPHTSHLKGNFWYYHHSPITSPFSGWKFGNNKNRKRISSFRATSPVSTTERNLVVEKSRQGPDRNSRLITYTTQEEQQAIVDNIFKIQNAFKKNTSKASLSTTEKHFIKPTTEKRNIILKNQEKLDEVMDDDNSTDFTILRPLSKEQIDDFIIIKPFPRVKSGEYSTERPRPVYIHPSSTTTKLLQTKPTTMTPLQKPTPMSSFLDVFPDILNNVVTSATQQPLKKLSSTTKPSSTTPATLSPRFLEKARTEKLVSGSDYHFSKMITLLCVLFHAFNHY